MLCHKHFLQRLGELSGCSVTFMDGLYGHAVGLESRSQDLFCDNSAIANSWDYVNHKVVPVRCERRRNDIHVTAKECCNLEFDWRGFRVKIEFSKRGVYWDCNTDIPSEDPIYLSDLSGFILRISYIIDNTVYDGFMIPSLLTRFQPFRFAVYKCKVYNLKSEDKEWFRKLSKLSPETNTMTNISSDYVNMLGVVTVLVEEAQVGAAELNRVGDDTTLVHGAFYERLNISV